MNNICMNKSELVKSLVMTITLAAKKGAKIFDKTLSLIADYGDNILIESLRETSPFIIARGICESDSSSPSLASFIMEPDLLLAIMQSKPCNWTGEDTKNILATQEHFLHFLLSVFELNEEKIPKYLELITSDCDAYMLLIFTLMHYDIQPSEEVEQCEDPSNILFTYIRNANLEISNQILKDLTSFGNIEGSQINILRELMTSSKEKQLLSYDTTIFEPFKE